MSAIVRILTGLGVALAERVAALLGRLVTKELDELGQEPGEQGPPAPLPYREVERQQAQMRSAAREFPPVVTNLPPPPRLPTRLPPLVPTRLPPPPLLPRHPSRPPPAQPPRPPPRAKPKP